MGNELDGDWFFEGVEACDSLAHEVPCVGFCVVSGDCYCLVLVNGQIGVSDGEEEVAVT